MTKKEERKIYMKSYYEINKEKIKARAKAWNETHPENHKAHQMAYNETHKEENKTRQKDYRKSNPDKINAKQAREKAQRLNATPSWLTKEQHEKILIKYTEAQDLSKSTGIPHHVDHIIALQGKSVSGLHVPWNLQVITAKENWEKGNRLIEEII